MNTTTRMFYALGALLVGPDVVNKGPFPVFTLVHKHKQQTSSPLAFLSWQIFKGQLISEQIQAVLYFPKFQDFCPGI